MNPDVAVLRIFDGDARDRFLGHVRLQTLTIPGIDDVAAVRQVREIHEQAQQDAL